MLVKYFIFVLAFITTFVILVDSQSPHVSLSSYRYDPNSIPQNEKILQLFLRLASHTAGKIFLLKQQTLEQQLHNLKQNEKIADASQSELNIKNMIETFLRSSSDSNPPTFSSSPGRKNLTTVNNTSSAELNESLINSSDFYQTQNPGLPNSIQNPKTEYASEEMNSDSQEILENSRTPGSSMEIQNRLMVDYAKDNNNSQPAGQNLLNSGQIPTTINSGTDSGSLNTSGSNLSNGESSNNLQNLNPNNQKSFNLDNQQTSNLDNQRNLNPDIQQSSNLNNQQSFTPNNQPSSNPNNQQSFNSNNQQHSNSNPTGSNQMGQDPGSVISNMFNPATITNMIPLSKVNNVPVIGSGLTGPINMAQETLSKFGPSAPQLRAFLEIENGTNPVQNNSKEENERNGTSFQNLIISENVTMPENISVTEKASSMDKNKQNDNAAVTEESVSSFDNETSTNYNLDELTDSEKKSSLLEENTAEANSNQDRNQTVDKIQDTIQDKIQDEILNKTQDKVQKKVEALELLKENLEQNGQNKNGEDSKVKLKRLTDQVMRALRDMQDEIDKDRRDSRKELGSSFSNLQITTLSPEKVNPHFRPKDLVFNSEESVQKTQTENPKAPTAGR